MYATKKYDGLMGTEGFSEAILKNHFTLYDGYVKNTNTIMEKLSTLAKDGKHNTPEYNELKRHFGWEYNGMRLHELYFENMTSMPSRFIEGSALGRLIGLQWGSYGEWMKDFRSVGTMRGIGWAVLAQDKQNGMLFNVWINEHDVGHLVGANPLLVMDVFEHAYMLDYGIQRVAYIDAFWNAINWRVVESRVQ